MVEPSRGAMLAADEIWGQMSNKSRALSSLSLRSLADIVDRNTGHVVLLEALRNAKREMIGLAAYMETCEPSVIVDNLPSLAKALNLKVDAIEAAIQKAERT